MSTAGGLFSIICSAGRGALSLSAARDSSGPGRQMSQNLTFRDPRMGGGFWVPMDQISHGIETL